MQGVQLSPKVTIQQSKVLQTVCVQKVPRAIEKSRSPAVVELKKKALASEEKP